MSTSSWTRCARQHVFLVSIELDAQAGRFPDVLLQYSRDVDRDDRRAFFVAPIRHLDGEGYPVGRLTFEAEAGDLARVLDQDGGIRWGAALRVWGLQVPADSLSEVLARSPFELNDLSALRMTSRAAWMAADDLDALGLWLSPSVDHEVRVLLGQPKAQSPSD